MKLVRSTLLVLTLVSPLAGCFSYSSHESNEGPPYAYRNGYYDGYTNGYSNSYYAGEHPYQSGYYYNSYGDN
jgi:hypothetical protein